MTLKVVAPPVELLDRPPPQDLFAEKALLGSILIDGDRWDDVCLIVRARDFHGPANAKIFEAMAAIADDGKRPDLVLLRSRLKKLGVFEEIGAAYLAEVVECVPTSHNAEHYAELVAKAASARAIIDAGVEMIRAGHDESLEPRERLAKAERRFFEILEGAPGDEPASAADILRELSDDDEEIGLPSGFESLDSATGGLREGELTILAARPAMGKSALAANIAAHVAIELRRGVLLVSLEMSRREVIRRIVASRAAVDSRTRTAQLSDAERRRRTAAANEIAAAPLFVDAKPGRNMSEIASMARRSKRRNDLALLVIDYLQLIEPENPRDIREQQVALISKKLKRLAGEVNVPVLCLAQLNRQAESSRDNRPRLNHLRESGSIEQDADVVLLMNRPDVYETNPANHTGRASLDIAKQRNGPTGVIELNWRPEWTRFENIETEDCT